MTIAFTETINKEPNFFVEKIWLAINEYNLTRFPHVEKHNYKYEFVKKFSHFWQTSKIIIKPKLHTICKSNRFKAGDNIHMVINNRTKDRFQFAPAIKCVSVQEIHVDSRCVLISNGKNLFNPLNFREAEQLAINDGFESLPAFFEYFSDGFKGQIIHWTDLRY